jgi:large subunit ribosomal protein L13
MSEFMHETVIDASGLILGRMASTLAKRLLNGEKVTVVNAEKAVISGKRKNTIEEAREFLEIGHPGKGPYHPRRPDRIVRRTVRGMLPRRKPKGQQAYKRLRVYIGVPEHLKDRKMETISGIDSSRLSCQYIKVSDLAREIGWNPGGE